MPDALKGLDLVVHNVFSSLGLKVEIRPILDPFELEQMEKLQYDEDIDRYETNMMAVPVVQIIQLSLPSRIGKH